MIRFILFIRTGLEESSRNLVMLLLDRICEGPADKVHKAVHIGRIRGKKRKVTCKKTYPVSHHMETHAFHHQQVKKLKLR